MRKIFAIFTIILFTMPCFCQNTVSDDVALKLRDYLSAAEFEEADIFFKAHNNELDSMTCDVLRSVINIGLSAQGKTIDIKCTIDCIRRVINEFAEYKEEIKPMASEMMPYFNIYVSYLSSIDNPLYIDVYRVFKEIWPAIDKPNSVIYIAVLENTSIKAFIEKRYNEVIPILNELIELKGQGYQLSSKPYVNYAFLGECYQNTGNEDKAVTYYDKSLMSFSKEDKIEESATYMNVVRSRFEVAFKLSQISKCREFGRALLAYYGNKNEFLLDYINVSMELAEIELSALNTKDGVHYYENGLQLILRSSNFNIDSKKGYLENLYTIYNTYDINKKDRLFQSEVKAYNINIDKKISAAGVDEQYIDSLNAQIGNSETESITNVKQFVNDINALANNYGGRHQELRGIKLIENAIYRCQSNNIKEQEYVKLYSSLGSIYHTIFNIDKALDSHKKANNIYSQNGMYNADYIDNLCCLADDYCYKKEYAKAKAYLEVAWEISQSMDAAFMNEKSIYYHLLQSSCELYRDLDDEDKSLSYNSMLIEDISNNDKSGVFKKVYQQARVNLLLYFEQYKEAQKLLDEIGNEYIDKYGGEWTSFETKYFNNDISCVEYMERIFKKDTKKIVQSYSSFRTSDLNDYWDIYGGNLNMAFSMSLCKFNTPALRTSTYNNLLFTKNFQQELHRYNRAHPNEMLSSTVAANILKTIGDVNMIKEKLNENEVAVEFFYIKDRKTYKKIENKYGALILKKNSREPIFVELCPCDSLDLLVYNNSLGEAETYASQVYGINNRKLYHLIWEPLENLIPTKAKVYASACGSLLSVNLSAISNGEKRLNELYDIHNVISTSSIISKKTHKHNYETASLFGGIDYDASLNVMANEAKKYAHNTNLEQYDMLRGENERGSWGKLKYSLEETDSIATYLSKNHLTVMTYTQSNASEEAFKSLSGASPDIIHISTHGFYYQPYAHSYRTNYSNQYFTAENNNKLNFNGLLFSGANNAWKYNKYQDYVEDGILTAKEIYSLNLSNTDLLILSACQTGLGENNEISGNEGLLKAFKVAGVNEMIVTLWNISDDATSTIMKKYYENLLKYKNPKDALEITINRIKREMPDPYYWAPFILVE